MPADFLLREGDSPLIISFPHHGHLIPAHISRRMTWCGQNSTDTDWHIRNMYDFLDDWPVTTLTATWSRYVIDLNRATDGALLYPGKMESALCPTMSFDGEPLYLSEGPDQHEQINRTKLYWQPYHQCLQKQIERIKARHGYVVLWDAHSIRGEVASLFDGELPILSIGTHSGQSAAAQIDRILVETTQRHSNYSVVANQRFKGGYITRHYGKPAQNQHAVQLEINQSSYLFDQMQVPPIIDPRKKQLLAQLLRILLETTQNIFAKNQNSHG